MVQMRASGFSRGHKYSVARQGDDFREIEMDSFSLTKREKEVLTCLVKGKSYKLIADNCFISIETVNNHIRNIYKKMQVHSKTEAVAKVMKRRIF